MNTIRKIQDWIEIRKRSTIAHWLFGFLCCFIAMLYFPAGLTMMGIFAGMEWWNDKENQANNPSYPAEGCTDWWESFVMFCIGLVPILVLHFVGVISIRWI